jgi:hypothetical protein
MEEIDHASAAALASAPERPAKLAHAAGARDQIAGGRVPGQVIDQHGALVLVHELAGDGQKLRCFDDADRRASGHTSR